MRTSKFAAKRQLKVLATAGVIFRYPSYPCQSIGNTWQYSCLYGDP